MSINIFMIKKIWNTIKEAFEDCGNFWWLHW